MNGAYIERTYDTLSTEIESNRRQAPSPSAAPHVAEREYADGGVTCLFHRAGTW